MELSSPFLSCSPSLLAEEGCDSAFISNSNGDSDVFFGDSNLNVKLPLSPTSASIWRAVEENRTCHNDNTRPSDGRVQTPLEMFDPDTLFGILPDLDAAIAPPINTDDLLLLSPPPSFLSSPPREAPVKKEKTTTLLPKVPTGTPDAAASTRAPDFVFDPQRVWSTVFADRSILTSTEDDVEIRAKTRSDAPCLSVPERLYSSLKYEIRQCAVGPFTSKFDVLLSRICVVDAETGSEVLRNNLPAVKGTIEAALTKPTDKKRRHQSPLASSSVLEGNLRAQFHDISFHPNCTLYCWSISYFDPSDRNRPILIKCSPAFKVFARKPDNKRLSRKRKKDAFSNSDNDDEEYTTDGNSASIDSVSRGESRDTTDNPHKKIKSEPPASSCPPTSTNAVFEEFICKLDELVKCKDRLTEQERHVCLDLVVSKLLAADPSYFAALANSPQPSAADSFAPQQPDSSFILSPDCSSSSSFRRSPSTNLSF